MPLSAVVSARSGDFDNQYDKRSKDGTVAADTAF